MIFKYISQRLLFLNLPPEYKENYVNRLQHMKLKYREAHNRKGTILKKVCNKFLLLCE